MIEANISNWAAFAGLTLLIYWIPASLIAWVKLFYISQKPQSRNTEQYVIQAFGRSLGLLVGGFILFFQGWRLDQTLQLVPCLLVLGIFAESLPTVVADYKNWSRIRASSGE